MEKTFVMIKPCGVHHKDDILNELDNHGKRTKVSQIDKVPKKVIEEHYGAHKEKSFFNDILKHFENKSVVIAVYEGENIVEKFKDLMGPTEPKKGTLRGKYSEDTYAEANKRGSPVLNVIHRSGSLEEAEKEIEIWKAFFN